MFFPIQNSNLSSGIFRVRLALLFMYCPTIKELGVKKVETTLHRKAERAFRFNSHISKLCPCHFLKVQKAIYLHTLFKLENFAIKSYIELLKEDLRDNLRAGGWWVIWTWRHLTGRSCTDQVRLAIGTTLSPEKNNNNHEQFVFNSLPIIHFHGDLGYDCQRFSKPTGCRKRQIHLGPRSF